MEKPEGPTCSYTCYFVANPNCTTFGPRIEDKKFEFGASVKIYDMLGRTLYREVHNVKVYTADKWIYYGFGGCDENDDLASKHFKDGKTYIYCSAHCPCSLV